MAIDKEVIRRFLEKPEPNWPDTRDMNIDEIERLVYDSTGCHLSFKSEPRMSQFVGVAFALYMRRALLFHAMRTGKTGACLYWAQHLRNANLWRGKGIVIVHAPVLLDIWKTQAEKHSDLKTCIVGTKIESMQAAIESDADLLLCSWTGLKEFLCEKRMSAKKQGMKLYLLKQLAAQFARHFSLAIIDEIHVYSNPYGLPFEIAAALTANCNLRIGGTGTPFGRDPFKLWAQAFLIDRGKTFGETYGFFQQAFGKQEKVFFSPYPIWKFDQDKLPYLNKKLPAIAQSYERKEFEEGVTKNIIDLDMKGDQAKAYYEALESVVTLHDRKLVEIKSAFTLTRQIASGFLPYHDEAGDRRIVRFRSNVKLTWLKAILEELDDTQFIIFHEYTESGEMLGEALKAAKIKYDWIHGSGGNKTKTIAAFERGRLQAVVVQSAAGGVGVELAAADYMLFYESPVDPLIRDQAEKRALGEARGKRPLIIDDLACSPIEHRVLRMVQEGKDVMRDIIYLRKEFAK